MESEYFEIASLCQATTPQELVNCLKKPNMEVVDRTNELFEDESIKGTCYSENVFRVICQEMGID